MKALLIIVAVSAAAGPMLLQSAGTQTPKPVFEVASIKPGSPVLTRISVQILGNRFLAENFNLKMLVARAYGMPENRVIGGPGWVDSDRYNLEAKAEGATIPPNQLGPMLQSLLEDRFQLKAHLETRELPIYELVVARGGPKLKMSEDQTPPAPMSPADMAALMGRGGRGAGPAGPPPRGMFNRGNGQYQGTSVRLNTMVNALTQQLGRPVIDKTGLDALYDISLKWTPGAEQVPNPFALAPPLGGAAPPPPDPSGPSIFTALQEQLGLRLESTKGPMEVVIIDSAEKPAEN
jgi:uncharacterized protein (TIGR03435 family)